VLLRRPCHDFSSQAKFGTAGLSSESTTLGRKMEIEKIKDNYEKIKKAIEAERFLTHNY